MSWTVTASPASLDVDIKGLVVVVLYILSKQILGSSLEAGSAERPPVGRRRSGQAAEKKFRRTQRRRSGLVFAWRLPLGYLSWMRLAGGGTPSPSEGTEEILLVNDIFGGYGAVEEVSVSMGNDAGSDSVMFSLKNVVPESRESSEEVFFRYRVYGQEIATPEPPHPPENTCDPKHPHLGQIIATRQNRKSTRRF